MDIDSGIGWLAGIPLAPTHPSKDALGIGSFGLREPSPYFKVQTVPSSGACKSAPDLPPTQTSNSVHLFKS